MSIIVSTSACFQSTGSTPTGFRGAFRRGLLDTSTGLKTHVLASVSSEGAMKSSSSLSAITAFSSSFQRVFVVLCVSHLLEAFSNSALKSGAMAPFKIAKNQVMEMIYALCQTVDPLRISVSTGLRAQVNILLPSFQKETHKASKFREMTLWFYSNTSTHQ